MTKLYTFSVNEKQTVNDGPSAIGSFGVKRKKSKDNESNKKKSHSSDGKDDSNDSDYC